jgi:hypothetical protein
VFSVRSKVSFVCCLDDVQSGNVLCNQSGIKSALPTKDVLPGQGDGWLWRVVERRQPSGVIASGYRHTAVAQPGDCVWLPAHGSGTALCTVGE